LEELEKSKRDKIRSMRKEMEKELTALKSKNRELFASSQGLEDELDKAVRRVDEVKDENRVIQEEKEMFQQQIGRLNEINMEQEKIIGYL
jgi:prefoldin subunit 5